MKTPISVTLITRNEERNIGRTLENLRWADEILVVDSQSSDQTVSIAQAMGAKVIQNPFKGYGQQKNFAQDHAKHDWILNLDADEVLSKGLKAEIQKLQEKKLSRSTTPFAFARKTIYFKRWIRYGGWYPNWVTRLYPRQLYRWSEPHLHEKLIGPQSPKKLKHPVFHYTFRGVEDQIATNLRYARLGAHDLKPHSEGWLRFKLFCKPFGKFLETYIVKRGFLDGIPGLIISLNAAQSMFLKYCFLWEERHRKEISSHEVPDRRL